MHRTSAILSIVLIALGLVWIGQGTGVLAGRSFMVGDARWTAIGAVCLILGVALGWRALRRGAG
jgi:hypothetical protein